MEFWHCFLFWYQCVYLAIKIQIFNRHFMPFSVRKMSRRIFKDCHRQTPNLLSESIVWLLRHSQTGQFFSHRRWMELMGFKHHKSMRKQRFQHLKAICIHFMQFCSPWITRKKWHSNTFRSSFKMTKKSLLVTFSTTFFLPFHLAIRRQRCPKSLG